MSLENTDSTYSDDDTFRELEAYCWEEDPEFQSGLTSIISSASNPEQVRDLTKQAKCYFYSRKIGHQIDFDEYNEWLHQQENQPESTATAGDDSQEHHPSSAAVTAPVDLESTKQTLNNDHTSNNTSLSSQAQLSSTTTDTKPTTTTTTTTTTTDGDGDAAAVDTDKDEKAPYPMSFAHIVELITTGKPIPGIKQIPDTLHGEEASTVSAKAPRRKPWETTLAGTQAQT